jgi:hypothetical protein
MLFLKFFVKKDGGDKRALELARMKDHITTIQ